MSTRIRGHKEPFFFFAAAWISRVGIRLFVWNSTEKNSNLLLKLITLHQRVNAAKPGSQERGVPGHKSIWGRQGVAASARTHQRSPGHSPVTLARPPHTSKPQSWGALRSLRKGEHVHRTAGVCRDDKPQQAVAKTSVVQSTHICCHSTPSPSNSNSL